ncbi:MAG: hypothetical protein LQ346_004340 [Caloplaca aetnensis]|nr:MAG: hypothetical protein LQ346_004340 [Caloplaca aetnensis]
MFGFKREPPNHCIEDSRASSDATPSCAVSGNKHNQLVHRSSQHEAEAPEEPSFVQQLDTKSPHVKRQASKGRLLGLFSRAKSTKLPSTGSRVGSPRNVSPDQQRFALQRSNTTPSFQDNGNMSFTDLTFPAKTPKQQSVKAKRTKSFRKDPSTTKSMQWYPPPLFQAYPQSVKHGTTFAPVISADSILRFHAERKRRQRKNDTTLASLETNGVDEQDDTVPGVDREELQEVDLAQKIYVLVTSGYILQYAGEGSYDRLPEKILPIGPDSAAFASDAVPGKHWVLQVSHALGEDGIAKLEKRSFVKKLRLGGDMRRCSALNFLMVFSDPEDLCGWLTIVKGELEAWGGKNYHQDPAFASRPEEPPQTLHQRPSRRYLVKRDPIPFSNMAKESNAAFNGALSGATTPSAVRKHSTATQDSMQSPSTSNVTASTDQVLLDRLRSSPKMSPISTGTKVFANSRESSAIPSPNRLKFDLDDFCTEKKRLNKDGQPADLTGQFPVQHLPQRPHDHFLPPTLTQPLTTMKNLAKAPNAAPNFNVPNFSKRYSSAHSSPPPLSTASSNNSNPSRKPTSPPTISEQHDDFQDIADAAAEASATEQQDAVDLPVGDFKEPISSSLSPASNDRALPRRFSSLAYSRGISPVNSRSSRNASPHPPPTSALPALPESDSNNLAVPGQNLRRPLSVQIRTCPLPLSAAEVQNTLPPVASTPTDGGTRRGPPFRAPPPPPSVPSKPLVHFSDQHLTPPGKVLNRRSMPQLNRPPSDPPKCPLPTPPVPRLPPIKLSSGSLRRSVERPMRAGLGPRAAGLVEGTEP